MLDKIVLTPIVAWFVAQTLKLLIDLWLYKKIRIEKMISAGGMPSSHSSTVTSLATTAFLKYGVNSFEFSICMVLALIVMYDAAGVRFETGKQAKILNVILEENPFNWTGEILDKRMKELVGHTPLQVLAGALLGVGVATAMNYV